MIKKAIILSVGIATFTLSAYADDKAATEAAANTETKEVASALELFPEKLYNAEGKEVSRDDLKGKIVGIYFSAHWCPPCRAFTPSLVEFRNKNKDNFEIVFVSSDRDEAAQMGYMKETEMKWLAVKFGAQEIKDLKSRYKVKGIPSLVIIGPDGKTITDNGRGDVSKKPDTALESWQKKANIKSA